MMLSCYLQTDINYENEVDDVYEDFYDDRFYFI